MRLRGDLESSLVEQARLCCEMETFKEQAAELRTENELLRSRLDEKDLYLSYWKRVADKLIKEKESKVI